jgi:hypothetical protein
MAVVRARRRREDRETAATRIAWNRSKYGFAGFFESGIHSCQMLDGN